MDYSKCNFVSVSKFSRKQDLNPMMRVNVKNGIASLSRSVNSGLAFVLIEVDKNKKAIRLNMSKTEGSRVHYEAKSCTFYLPKSVHKMIVHGFNSAKSKVINLEKGDDGAWYGNF